MIGTGLTRSGWRWALLRDLTVRRPSPLSWAPVQFVGESGDVTPRLLSNRLLDKCLPRSTAGNGAHVVQVAAGKPPHLRELGPQVGSEAFDDLGAPPLGVLAVEVRTADVPVPHQQFGVDHPIGL